MKRHLDKLFSWVVTLGAILSSFIVVLVFFNILKESIPFFKSINWQSFFIAPTWMPLAKTPSYSILPMILATLYVSFLSIFIAVPIGIGCSFFLCFCIRKDIAKILLSFIDLLAGVPSVIFGFMGLLIIVKFMEKHFNMASGESVFAGSLLLAIMLLPYIITGCTETLEIARKKYYTTSLSLGVSKWYTLRKVILPYTLNSIASNTLLAFGRAMGETMAVMMVMGNAPILPRLLGRAETIPSLIALEMGSAVYKSPHYHALYASGVILIILLVLIQFIAKRLSTFGNNKGDDDEK